MREERVVHVEEQPAKAARFLRVEKREGFHQCNDSIESSGALSSRLVAEEGEQGEKEARS
jgi:hypothetical protein